MGTDQPATVPDYRMPSPCPPNRTVWGVLLSLAVAALLSVMPVPVIAQVQNAQIQNAQIQNAQMQPLACTAQNLGQSVCQAEGVCKCAYSAGGTMLRQPPGYAWDCSLTYGKCSAGAAYPLLSRAVTPAPTVLPPRQVGAEGGSVRAVQQALKDLGYDPGAVDGVMGRRSRTAISAWQKGQGLPETGRLTADQQKQLLGAGG